MQYHLKVKTVVVGPSGVGKSSMVMRYVHGKFSTSMHSTIGAAFYPHHLEPIQDDNGDDYIVQYEIWDTAGQERYAAMMPMYYRNAHVIIVAFSLINQHTFAEAKRWVAKLQEYEFPNQKQPLIVLMGTKLDLAETHRGVREQDARRYAEEEALMYIETSALKNINVNKLFARITQIIMNTKKDELANQLAYSTINLHAQHEAEHAAQKRGGVCMKC